MTGCVINKYLSLLLGRSWTAAELRRKSFKDLHTLWYVLLRERNLLASQREEARRMDVTMNALRGGPRVHVVRVRLSRVYDISHLKNRRSVNPWLVSKPF